MPARSVVITCVLVLAALLTVALWSRYERLSGQERAIVVGPTLTIATARQQPVCFAIEHSPPGGAPTLLAWGVMDNVRSMSAIGVTFPTTGTLTIRWAAGKQLAFQYTGGTSPVGWNGNVYGGTAIPGQNVIFVDVPGQTDATVGACTLASDGTGYNVRIDPSGLRVIGSVPQPPAAPAPPAPPLPSKDSPGAP